MHQRQDLPTLSDQPEPLGPCDESGRRGVHQSESLSLVCFWLGAPADAAGALPLALGLALGKGKSGSAIAALTGFVAGAWLCGVAVAGLGGAALGGAGFWPAELSGTL